MNYDLLSKKKLLGNKPIPMETSSSSSSSSAAASSSSSSSSSPSTTVTTSKPRNDIEKQLQGYVVVPREEWNSLERTDHIRYIGKDGKYRRGSFIKCIWERNGKRFFQLETSIGGEKGDDGYVTFPVCFDDIMTLYRKIRQKNRCSEQSLENKLIRLEKAIKALGK